MAKSKCETDGHEWEMQLDPITPGICLANSMRKAVCVVAYSDCPPYFTLPMKCRVCDMETHKQYVPLPVGEEEGYYSFYGNVGLLSVASPSGIKRGVVDMLNLLSKHDPDADEGDFVKDALETYYAERDAETTAHDVPGTVDDPHESHVYRVKYSDGRPIDSYEGYPQAEREAKMFVTDRPDLIAEIYEGDEETVDTGMGVITVVTWDGEIVVESGR